jgi:predicted SprT family Zn-dependent metalloprotease
MKGITKHQFNTLEDLFTYYNAALFESQLPYCLINLSRHRYAMGYFISENWKSNDGQPNHEISINPDTMHRGDEDWHSTLVHEMCHLWQAEFGKPSDYNYHNKQWANKMFEIGLMPSKTGEPGGAITGRGMSHYILNTGLFIRAFQAINLNDLKNLRLPFTTNVAKLQPSAEDQTEVESLSKSGVKIKYSCNCGTNVWGKSGLQLRCLTCNSNYTEQCRNNR